MLKFRKRTESTPEFPKKCTAIASSNSNDSMDTIVDPPPNQSKPSPPRVIFISFYYFIQCWETIPVEILDYSIFLFTAVKRSWIFGHDESGSSEAKKWSQLVETRPELIQVLLIKEEQKLLVWRAEIDDNQNEINHIPSLHLTLSSTISQTSNSSCELDEIISDDSNVLPTMCTSTPSLVWWKLSVQLSRITDPITKKGYKPLCMDLEQWLNMQQTPVFNELVTGDGNFAAIKTIIENSNPNLIPMLRFDPQLFTQNMRRIANNLPLDSIKSGVIRETIDEYGFTHLLYENETL